MHMRPKCTNTSAHYDESKIYPEGLPHHDTDDVLDDFIKKEIFLAKTCGCDFCVFRKNMFRRMQEIIKERNLS